MKFIDDETLEKILYGIIILLLFIILFVVIFKEDKDNSSNTNNDIVAALPEEKEIIEDKEEENITKISVDVKGAVKKEGVYELDSGARVNDQTTTNMIQRISRLFAINPLISKEIKPFLNI